MWDLQIKHRENVRESKQTVIKILEQQIKCTEKNVTKRKETVIKMLEKK